MTERELITEIYKANASHQNKIRKLLEEFFAPKKPRVPVGRFTMSDELYERYGIGKPPFKPGQRNGKSASGDNPREGS